MTQDLEPSPPPDMPRRIRLHRFQLIGIPLVFLLPLILALTDVFGEASATATAETATVTATVTYPARLRYKQLAAIEVWLENRTAAAIDTVTIAIDGSYASRFSGVDAIPPFDEPYRSKLLALTPGERRLAIVELQAERYGRHEGMLRIGAGDTGRVRLRTIVFP